jgi:hypothetical protein
MATVQELERALINADKAGDVEAARQLAAAIISARQKPEPSISDEIGRQVGLTARGAAEGLAGLAAMVTDPVTGLVNKALPAGSQIPMLRETVSGLMTQAGLPQPQNATERVVNQAVQAMAGGAGTIGLARGAMGALSGQVGQTVAGQLAAQPGAQIAGAAGSGTGVGIAQENDVSPLGQVAAGLAGGVAGASLANALSRPRIAPQPQPTNVQGIEMMTSDVLPPKTFASRLGQTVGERVPFTGTGPLREKQQVQRIDAVKNLLKDFGADDAAKASDNVMADLAGKRAAEIAKYATTKNQVLQAVDTAGPVPVPKAVTVIDDEIAKLQSLNTAEVQPVIAKLDDFKQAIQGQNMLNVEELRKQLGEGFKSPDLVSVRSTGEKAVGKIYGALRSDMGEFIKQNGAPRDFLKWSVSNRRLSDMAGELDMGVLKRTLATGDATPEVVQSMLFSKKPSEITQLYRGLTPVGKANAQIAILARAAEKAGGVENISPDKFANEVKRLSQSVGVFFNGSDLQRVQGLVRALDATKRAGQAAALPTTGVQGVPFVAGTFLTDLLGSGGAAIASAVSIGGLARAYESKTVRDILMRLPKTVKGSAEEAALIKRLLATMPQIEEPSNGL